MFKKKTASESEVTLLKLASQAASSHLQLTLEVFRHREHTMTSQSNIEPPSRQKV